MGPAMIAAFTLVVIITEQLQVLIQVHYIRPF